jgi:hypothetical protein
MVVFLEENKSESGAFLFWEDLAREIQTRIWGLSSSSWGRTSNGKSIIQPNNQKRSNSLKKEQKTKRKPKKTPESDETETNGSDKIKEESRSAVNKGVSEYGITINSSEIFLSSLEKSSNHKLQRHAMESLMELEKMLKHGTFA